VSIADLRAIRRRFSLLLALRFVPTGLFVTVFVLLLRDRGLSLAEIGLGTAAQGLVMLFLELPSGGLADALGRKPVLVLASLFSMAAIGLLLVADTVLLLAAVSSLQGVFRALDSGPLEAWFIDASLAADPEVDIERGLARQNIVICSSIGVGALLGGVIAATDGFLGIDALVAPLVLGLVIQAVGLVAVVTLMDEVRPGRGWAAARQAVADVPTVVGEGVAIIRASSVLTALVIGELLWGFGMVAFETLLPPRLAEVSGGVDDAAALLGPAITAAWVLSALGAAVSPALVRRFGAPWAGFGLRLAHGATVVGMGLAAGPAGLIVAYLATYWVHGATAPVHYGMVHRGVASSHRATVVSANSLTSQVGAAVSGILLGALADATSITMAMLVAAVVLAAAAPLYLVGRRPAAPSLEEPIPLHR
jgi:predicted MFS family arabinose efflux permease